MNTLITPPEINGCTHHLLGEDLILLPQKAIYWPSKKYLILSDLHFGKATHFRKHGIAVPSEVALQNFDTLSQLLKTTQATEIFLLGDLFHSTHNSEWEQFKTWRNDFPLLTFHLVMGNHDILNGKEYAALNLKVHPTTYIVAPFIFTHKPMYTASPLGYNIAGHIHPSVQIRGSGKQKIKLNCFYFSKNYAVLPAFGSFTGSCCIETSKGDDVFLVLDNSVVKM